MTTLTKAPADFKIKKPMYKPYKSSKAGKKGMVYVKGSGGNKRLIHFGDSSMQSFDQHKDKKRRANYLARSGGIRNKEGKLTAKDKNSPNYWARKILWNA